MREEGSGTLDIPEICLESYCNSILDHEALIQFNLTSIFAGPHGKAQC